MKEEDTVFKDEDFSERFLEMLKEDAKNLKELCRKWDEVSEDPKLELFIDKLKHEFFDKEINPTGKLVIFSESVDYQQSAVPRFPSFLSSSVSSGIL